MLIHRRMLQLFVSACIVYTVAFQIAQASSRTNIMLSVRGGSETPAVIRKGVTDTAVIFVHQSGGTMWSWSDLAIKLNEQGLTTLALGRITPDDVVAAYQYLLKREYTNIHLVGASMGGGAITQAVENNDLIAVRKMVLLAPTAGAAVKSQTVDKLILVAKSDYFGDRAYRTYNAASEPKKIIEFDGREHGQALLTGAHGETAIKNVLQFLLND